MFYLLKRVDEKQCTLGEKVMVLSDFTGVPAGTKGVVVEIYDEGVMVAWEKDGKTCDEIKAALDAGEMVCNARGFFCDGFSRDELEYLGFETAKHPKLL